MIKVDGVVLGWELFPNGEPKIHDILTPAMEIVWCFEDIRELFILETIPRYKECVLIMPYIPFSRMDRKVVGQAYTLPVFASIINSIEFYNVIVLEAHSDKSLELIENVKHIKSTMMIADNIIKEQHYDAIVYPDKGASIRFTQNKYPIITMNKQRDRDTGKLSCFEIVESELVSLKGAKLLIVDDLCSYGGTFIGVANVLKEAGADVVDLCVTHAEPAIYEGHLLGEHSPINHVYCTTSLQPKETFFTTFEYSINKITKIDFMEVIKNARV